MCGFFQVFQRGKAIEPERFRRAFAGMRHRGPDYSGVEFTSSTSCTPETGAPLEIASGHHRLSILDLDDRAHQPFVRDQATFLFNGEIYNFRSLRPGLESLGARFSTESDTEVLMQGLTLRGTPFLDECNGMWAFSHFDDTKALVTAARDRYGKKPLFYYQDQDCLCLSSTIQPIHEYLGTKQRMKSEFVDSYLLFGQMFPPAGEETHLHDIQQVEAGSIVEFNLRSWTHRSRRYFSLPKQLERYPGDDENLSTIVADAVQARLVSDRKVGLMLSGGVDSTLILSVLHATGYQEKVHCFIGETGRSPDALFGAECAKKLGIEARLVQLDYGKDTFSRMLRLCRHQEKPFPFLGSTMAMSEMYEAIAEHDVRVVLDGTGGDELFGGYWERQFPVAIREALATRDWHWLGQSLRHTPGTLAAMTGALKDILFPRALQTWSPKSVKKRYSPGPFLLGLNRSSVKPSDPFWNPPNRFADALMRDALPGGRLGEWIWHNDRNAMMSGIENRSPLLDYRLIPYLASGYRTKFHHQWNKHQLRQLFDTFSQLPTQWRQQKQGFRWNRKAFLRQNKTQLLELISASQYLAHRFRMDRFLDRARKHRKLLVSSTTLRLVCIAGIEAELGLAPE